MRPRTNHDHIVISAAAAQRPTASTAGRYVGNTPTVEVDAGESLRWYLFNLDLGSVWHNFHPHSSRWRLPNPPGGAADVHSLSPAESFVVDTEAPPALRLPCELEEFQCEPDPDACRVRVKGDFLFHCHIEEHMMPGLAGLVRSREYVWITERACERATHPPPLDDGANECPVVDPTAARRSGAEPPGRNDVITADGQLDATCRCPARAAHLAATATAASEASGSYSRATRRYSPSTPRCCTRARSCSSPAPATIRARHDGDFRSVVWDYENGGFHGPSRPSTSSARGRRFCPTAVCSWPAAR